MAALRREKFAPSRAFLRSTRNAAESGGRLERKQRIDGRKFVSARVHGQVSVLGALRNGVKQAPYDSDPWSRSGQGVTIAQNKRNPEARNRLSKVGAVVSRPASSRNETGMESRRDRHTVPTLASSLLFGPD